MKKATIDLEDNFTEQPPLGSEVSPTHLEEMRLAEEAELEKYAELVNLMAIAAEGGDHPTERDVLNWKKKFGKVYISTITGETDVYVWRPIFRQEWQKLQNGNNVSNQTEALVELCVLFPRFQDILYKKPAGTIPALETKILFQSGFVGDQYLLSNIKEIL